ncbi:MAG: UDP-N-acetylmuramoyl-L-alanine--D-glutamate ligase [Planctomycetes bacterium]|nr:UDP-N-acetylmuramoyl-L-alanine--D-glutamate ligase [Planctomycetota bacterium]
MQGITHDFFRGKKVTVMGLGLFEGGVGVVRFLVDQGAEVFVTDLKSSEDLEESLEKLDGLPISFHLGEHREEDFTQVDLVVVNPAVPKTSAYLALAREHGVPLFAEMNIFFQLCPAPIVGITGTNGKSTTTALVHAMLSKGERKAWLGGNIGQALLPEVHKISDEDIVILELSSFQLEDLQQIGRSPHVAVVTNVAPNHLDRHGTMADYIAAKKGIIINQTKGDFAVLNQDDPELRTWADEDGVGRPLFFSVEEEVEEGAFVRGDELVLRAGKAEEVVSLRGVQIPGRHNRQNIAAAAIAARVAGIKAKQIEAAASEFKGLEHRIEFFEEIDGVRFYNDSIATTPESAIAAIEALDCPIILIAGGYDKGSPFGTFARKVAEQVKCVILIGKTAEKIGAMVEEHRQDGGPPALFHERTFPDAVWRAFEEAKSGDAVLLSTGCASYDMFRNFADRGRQFKQLVREIKRQVTGGTREE